MRKRRIPWGIYLALLALCAFALGPIVLFAFNALKTPADLGANPLGVPTEWKWGNFLTAWNQANMGVGLTNSFVVVAGTILLTCLVAGMAAYALARLEVRGTGAVIVYLLVSSSLPMQLFLVPLFYTWTSLGLYDTLAGLILIYTGIFSPFATLLMRSFLISLPTGFEEAARIDGASELSILFRIVLPNAMPGVLTVALVTGLSAYNEFLFAVTFIQNSALAPVSTTFFAFQQGFTRDYTLISAAGLIMMTPMLVLFLVLQRRFVAGLASTGSAGT